MSNLFNKLMIFKQGLSGLYSMHTFVPWSKIIFMQSLIKEYVYAIL